MGRGFLKLDHVYLGRFGDVSGCSVRRWTGGPSVESSG